MSSNHLLDGSSPLLDSVLLDTPYLRSVFTDPDVAMGADMYHTRMGVERLVELQERTAEVITPEIVMPDYSNHHQGVLSRLEGVQSEIREVVASNEAGFSDVRSGLSDVSAGITDMSEVIHGDFRVLHKAVRTIYGANLPEGKTVAQLGRQISYDGKNTALAMYMLGGLDEEKARSIFGSDFLQCVAEGISQETAETMNERCYEGIEYIKKQKAALYKKQKKMDPIEFSDAMNDLDSRESNLRARIIRPEDVRLLGQLPEMRGKNVMHLVNEGLVNPKILEVMVRNGVVNGDVSDKLSRIIREDENGNIVPLVELSGVTGIFQQNKAQTMLQNMMVKQGAMQVSELQRANDRLDDINDQIGVSNEFLGGINEGVRQVNGRLENIQVGIWETNSRLGGIDMGIRETNSRLGGIDMGIRETNGHLVDIHEAIGYGNELLEHGNGLLEIANEQLGSLVEMSGVIANEIALTREVVAGLLTQLGNVMERGFDGVRMELQANRKELRTGNVLQAHTLMELGRQTKVLTDMSDMLKTPARTQADELYIQATELFAARQQDDAYVCFARAVDVAMNHIHANYGAGICAKRLGKHKEALRYFLRAERLAISQSQHQVGASALLEQAKIYVKLMNLGKAQMLLSKAEPLDTENVEILFLQANIYLTLRKTRELEITLEKIFVKIFIDKTMGSALGGYRSVMAMLQGVVRKYINNLIEKHDDCNLLDSVRSLQQFGFRESLILTVKYLMEKSPEQLGAAGVDIRKIVAENPALFVDIFNAMSWAPLGLALRKQPWYLLAYWGYRQEGISFEVVERLIRKGLQGDGEYLYLKRNVQEDKKGYRLGFINGFYSLGEGAKGMLRDFLQRNSDVNDLVNKYR